MDKGVSTFRERERMSEEAGVGLASPALLQAWRFRWLNSQTSLQREAARGRMLSPPGFKSESHRLGRHMGGPSREGFWMGLAEDVEWSAEVAEHWLTALRSGSENSLHTTEEIETALAKARSVMDNCHAGLRAYAHTLHEMSERACCVLCARPAS